VKTKIIPFSKLKALFLMQAFFGIKNKLLPNFAECLKKTEQNQTKAPQVKTFTFLVDDKKWNRWKGVRKTRTACAFHWHFSLLPLYFRNRQDVCCIFV
jgi:hypothetical protein